MIRDDYHVSISYDKIDNQRFVKIGLLKQVQSNEIYVPSLKFIQMANVLEIMPKENDEFIIIEAPADIINMFESNKEGLLCYDGNGRVTLSYALSSENKQFYDVVCANGVSFMNTHEGGVPFKTLFEDRKWYVAAHQFGDLLDIYSLHKDFTGDEFDFILSEFGKPDDYLVAGKHEVTIDTENTAFIYTMMIYEYENYNLVIRFAEQYANRDGVYEQTKMDVLESYLMSHYAMSDYLKDCKNSWGEACVFKSLDIY